MWVTGNEQSCDDELHPCHKKFRMEVLTLLTSIPDSAFKCISSSYTNVLDAAFFPGRLSHFFQLKMEWEMAWE